MRLINIIFCTILNLPFLLYAQDVDFIRLNEGKFLDGTAEFKMNIINYSMLGAFDDNAQVSYPSPNYNYSENWGIIPPRIAGRRVFDTANERITATLKLNRDLDSIKLFGFNTIRLYGFEVTFDSSGNIITNCCENPLLSEEEPFEILEEFLTLCETKGLRVIWVLGKPNLLTIPNNTSGKHVLSGYGLSEYREYLKKAANYFKNNKTLIAFDIYNELGDEYNLLAYDDKIKLSNWVKDWYFACKMNSPNHLVTIGMIHPNMIVITDPALFHVDFVNYHLYYHSADVAKNKEGLANDLYWISNVSVGQDWTMGEASFAGDSTPSFPNKVGSYAEQEEYADFFLQRNLDCGCLGPAWWEYSQYLDDGIYREHNGLVTKWDNRILLSEKSKPASNSFKKYSTLVGDKTKCQKGPYYYHKANEMIVICKGYVLANDGNPIENAVITATIGSVSYKTYSNAAGYYEVKAPWNYSQLEKLDITAYGYELYRDLDVPANGQTHRHSPVSLDKLVNNDWQLMWRNNYPGIVEYLDNRNSSQNDSGYFYESSNFFSIDVDGDGEEELLQIDLAGLSGGSTEIILYDYIKGILKPIWDNNNGSVLDDVLDNIYPTPALYRRLLIGNFDGLNGEDIMIFDLLEEKTYLFSYTNFNWSVLNTSYFNTTSTMMDYRSSFHVGDFNGDGKDEILGNNISQPNGWITLFEFDVTDNKWAWGNFSTGPTSHSLFQYRLDFTIGDFDGDGKDDILGRNSSSLAIFKFQKLFNTGFFVKSWQKNDPMYYLLPYSKLVVGNFDSDPNDELLAYGGWATKFDFEDNDFQWNWSTYSDTRIVEYSIFPVQPNHRLFFYKPYEHVPAYLFIDEGNDIAMYSMNRRIYNEQSLIKGKQDPPLKLVTDFSEPSPLIEVLLYPNPVSSALSFEVTSNELSEFEVVNSSGLSILTMEILDGGGSIDFSKQPQGVYFLTFRGTRSRITKKVIVID